MLTMLLFKHKLSPLSQFTVIKLNCLYIKYIIYILLPAMDAIFHFRCRRWKKMSLFRVDGINSLDVDINQMNSSRGV